MHLFTDKNVTGITRQKKQKNAIFRDHFSSVLMIAFLRKCGLCFGLLLLRAQISGQRNEKTLNRKSKRAWVAILKSEAKPIHNDEYGLKMDE